MVTARPLLTVQGVARHCGLSNRAVYDAIRRGELRALRVCSRIRIRPEDLDTWLAENAVAPDAPAPVLRSRSPLPPVTGSFKALLNGGGRREG